MRGGRLQWAAHQPARPQARSARDNSRCAACTCRRATPSPAASRAPVVLWHPCHLPRPCLPLLANSTCAPARSWGAGAARSCRARGSSHTHPLWLQHARQRTLASRLPARIGNTQPAAWLHQSTLQCGCTGQPHPPALAASRRQRTGIALASCLVASAHWHRTGQPPGCISSLCNVATLASRTHPLWLQHVHQRTLASRLHTLATHSQPPGSISPHWPAAPTSSGCITLASSSGLACICCALLSSRQLVRIFCRATFWGCSNLRAKVRR